MLVKKVDTESISKTIFSILFLVFRHKALQHSDVKLCLHRTSFLLIESLQSWDIDFFNQTLDRSQNSISAERQ